MRASTHTLQVTVIIIMILCSGLYVYADPLKNQYHESQLVSLADAAHVASQFLDLKDKHDDFTIKNIEIFYDDSNNVQMGYLTHLSPTGYLIIAPETSIQPVIAYSFTSSAPMDSKDNPLYQMVVTDVSTQRANYDLLPSELKKEITGKWQIYQIDEKDIDQTISFQQWPPEGSTSTEGWIETTWSQYDPYNAFCPIDSTAGNARSVAGCPAITMGQIFNYHQTINQVQFDDDDDYLHQYLSSFWIDDDYIIYDFPSFPELNGYLTTVENHFENNIDLTAEDIASICFACGVACKQVYSSAVSGTYGVDQAYDAYQRFSCDNATLYYTPDTSVLDIIIDNIKQALPVHFAVVTPQWNSGHNLNIDGYNTDGYFHLNFGWGGSYDGWYFIPDDLPYQLTVIEGVIVDILKKSTREDLQVSGSLMWQNITGGETVQGSFTIKNNGELNSLLTWEVVSTPEWGNWTITPSNGHSLRPIDGNVTVDVTCTVPNEYRKDYADSITIMNSNNPSDREYVPITLNLPKEKHGLSWIWHIISEVFPIIHNLFNLFQ